MKENQELQILKEAVNMALGGNLSFEDKEKIMHCFRAVQVQLQQFSELKDVNSKLRADYESLSKRLDQLKDNQIEVSDPQIVEGKPKKVLTK